MTEQNNIEFIKDDLSNIEKLANEMLEMLHKYILKYSAFYILYEEKLEDITWIISNIRLKFETKKRKQL